MPSFPWNVNMWKPKNKSHELVLETHAGDPTFENLM